MRPALLACLLTLVPAYALAGSALAAGPPMVVVDPASVTRDEPPPHGQIGMSTVVALTQPVPERKMEFRLRTLHPGAEIGAHVIAHDEVYYVLSGTGEVFSDGVRQTITAGQMAYLYDGADVGIKQTGDAPLALIISYPATKKP